MGSSPAHPTAPLYTDIVNPASPGNHPVRSAGSVCNTLNT